MSNPIWSGSLALGGLKFPVALHSGAREKHVEFRQLHCGKPTKQSLRCSVENAAIDRGTIMKGFEYAKDAFVMVTDTELAALAWASDTLDVFQCVPLKSTDPSMFEASYYLHPAADAEPAYASVFDALRAAGAAQGIAMIARIVLYGRQRWLLMRAGERGIIAHTLFYSSELRPLSEFRTQMDLARPEFTREASKAIKSLLGPLDSVVLADSQSQRILALLDEKIKAVTTDAATGRGGSPDAHIPIKPTVKAKSPKRLV